MFALFVTAEQLSDNCHKLLSDNCHKFSSSGTLTPFPISSQAMNDDPPSFQWILARDNVHEKIRISLLFSFYSTFVGQQR